MTRLIPRKILVEGSRKLSLTFYTSSTAKYLQAKLVCEAVGLRLSHRAHDDESYHENYEGTQEDLLIAAVRELRQRYRIRSPFFIEDTSIRIEALSPDKDYPGLAAKEWFKETTFEDLNQSLSNGSDRTAAVKSLIALSIPGRELPLFFYGETSGVVADKPAQFDPDPLLPWLSPSNFSAWFIPCGASRTLSDMSFEESLEHDFRVRSLLNMIDRLEEYAFILNSPPSSRTKEETQFLQPYGSYVQDKLFSVEPEPEPEPVEVGRVILVIGPPCAGKSTLGMFALERDNFPCEFVDASAIVRSKRKELVREDIEISEFARGLLRDEGPDVIARTIAQRYEGVLRDEILIATGFRTIEEIEFFRRTFVDVFVVSIEAPSRLRYQRYIDRASRTSLDTYDKFRAHDAEQHAFGLLRVAPLLADVRVRNVYSREIYYRQAARILGVSKVDVRGITTVSSRMDPETSQLYRCLVVLRRAGRPLTTQEIQTEFEGENHIRYNNANKMLKRYPELAKRQETSGSNVRYHITQGGLAFIAAIDRLQ